MSKHDYLYRKRAKGREYLYFRAPNGKLTPLPIDQKSAAFRAAYAAALRTIKPSTAEPQVRAAHEASIETAIRVYLESMEFAGSKPNTKRAYRRCLDHMRIKLGPAALKTLDEDAVGIYTEGVAKERGAAAADMHVAVISRIWQLCRKYPQFGIKGLPNPTEGAKKHYTKPKRPHVPWTAEAQETFMAAVPERLKLAKILLHFSAQRGGDCIKMKWSHFDGAGLFVWPEKAGGESLQDANYHLCPMPLLHALDAAPRISDYILVNAWGRPYASTACLSAAIRRELDKLGLRPGGKKTFTMHGLRKNAASEVGQLLVGSAGIMSVTGHQSKEMAEYYAAHAERIRMNRDVVEKWNTELARQEAERQKAEAEREKAEAVAGRRASIKVVK